MTTATNRRGNEVGRRLGNF
jgi:hypothetical protein